MREKLSRVFGSVSIQIAVLLICLLVPLNVVSVMATNQYALALEDQARHSIMSMTDLYLNDLRNKTLSATKYLGQQIVSNTNVITILKQQGDSAYTLAKNILGREFLDVSQQEYAGDVFFFYSPKLDDLLVNHRRSLTDLRQKLGAWLRANADTTNGAVWQLAEIDSAQYIVHSLKNYGMYFGSLISLDPLLVELPKTLGYTSAHISIDTQRSTELNPDMLCVTNHVGGIELYVHVSVDPSEIQSGMSVVQRIQMNFSLLYVALVPALLLILQFLLVRPLKKVNKALIRFRSGDSGYRIKSSASAHEFGVLQRSYNDMADSIEQLKIENYEQQVVRKEIELQNLQLTIRPHFLQNTLGLLYTLSQTGEIQKTGDFILYLSGYFRSIYQGLSALIPFSQELALIRSYMDIAQLQYPGNISFEYQVSSEALTVRVPSLLIHNFVENAISHALTKARTLNIRLTASVDGSTAHFQLTDDGSGIPHDMLRQINAGEVVTVSERAHVGLYNTYHRLQMIYAGRARLSVASSTGQGTLVDVFIPTDDEEASNA